jgi:cytochrome c-type biogenesis protein CcmH/NrfG
LVASVLLTDSVNNEKKNAKQALERAVKMDASYLNAVYLLSNLYMEEKNFDKAIEM